VAGPPRVAGEVVPLPGRTVQVLLAHR
jgi:hypothetical protein